MELVTEPALLGFARLCMPTEDAPFHHQVFNACGGRLGGHGCYSAATGGDCTAFTAFIAAPLADMDPTQQK